MEAVAVAAEVPEGEVVGGDEAVTDTDWQRLAGRLHQALKTALVESDYAPTNRRRRLLGTDTFTYVEDVLAEYEGAVAPAPDPPEDVTYWPDSRATPDTPSADKPDEPSSLS